MNCLKCGDELTDAEWKHVQEFHLELLTFDRLENSYLGEKFEASIMEDKDIGVIYDMTETEQIPWICFPCAAEFFFQSLIWLNEGMEDAQNRRLADARN